MTAATTARRASVLTAALLCAIATAPVLGQSRRPPKRQDPPTQPGQPGQPAQQPGQPTQSPAQQPGQQTPQPAAAQPGAPAAQEPPLEPSPYIRRVKPKRWTLDTHVFIGASQWLESQDGVAVPQHDTWEFTAATLVFPVLSETASSVLEVRGPADQEVHAVTGTVEIGDRVLASEPTIVTQGIGGGPLPAGTWRAQWQVEPSPSGAYTAREVEFTVSTAQASYETEFDERGASTIDWPSGPWPEEAASSFEPQMFVDYDMQGRGYPRGPIAALVQEWTEGQDPRKVKPVVLAKYLAGKVVEHVQLSGEGLTFDRTGLWQGFDTPGASAAAADGRGTEVDLPALLTAVYRAVGLPSRLVIGYDRRSDGKQIYLKQKISAPALRVWVEFYLYDEPNRTGGWVPVDPVQIRRSQSRMPKDFLERPLKYFGTHDELDEIAPIAFHFHPPTSVRSYGSPAFWGWFVTPTPPGRATQRVRFNMNTTPRGGNDESRLPARLRG